MDALAGLTVLDFTSHIAGPYATKLMADLGARVVKVERPGGDPARALGPFLYDSPGPDSGAAFQFLNTNKESVIIDLKAPRARDLVAGLVRRADLVVESFPPLASERLGLTYEDFSRMAADVPVVSITNFGPSGPYRDYRLSDTVLFAMGGEMFSIGLASREPLRYGGTAALLQCGAMAAVAALGAVHAREVHGIGQHVDVPLFDVQINNVDRRSSSILAYRFSGRIQGRAPVAGAGLAGGVYVAADGYVEVTASAGDYWARFVEMIDDDTLRGPRWQQPGAMLDPAYKEIVDGVVYPWMLSRTRLQIWEAARKSRALVAPLFTATDLFQDPVFRERGYWEEVEHETLGRFPMLGRPYVLEKTPWRIRRPAPRRGQDTDAILSGLGVTAGQAASLRQDGVVA
jgi:crotonobetainyl-CoA:carnitine CoA-transferase CaiB-like acyl-CoA transferase